MVHVVRRGSLDAPRRSLDRQAPHAVERCLFVGSDASYERLRSKLPVEDSRAKLASHAWGVFCDAPVSTSSPNS